MDIYRKFAILIIIIIAFYILYRLIAKRQAILHKSASTIPMNIEGMTINQTEKNGKTIEGLSAIPSATIKRVLDIEKNNSVTLSLKNLTENSSNNSKPLGSFFIKSSFNSAYDGNAVSQDMVLYILSRGYRFLDFEVYYDISNGTFVGFSNTGAWPSVSNTNVLFSDIIETVTQNCFKNPCPNMNDPLFIQIRPMYQLFNDNDDTATKQMKTGKNNQLNTQIETALGKISDYNLQYKGSISANTNINSLMGKIVVIMDNTSNAMNAKTDSLKSKINLSPAISNNSASKFVIKKYGELEKTQPDAELYEIIPYDNRNKVMTYNPNVLSIVSDTACNICPILAWLPSYISGLSAAGVSELGSYELFFNNAGGSAFIQIDEAKSYANANNTNRLNSKILSV